jgi:hypothetical protein
MFKSLLQKKRGRGARLLAVATVLTVLLSLIVPVAAFGETPDATDTDVTSEVDSSLPVEDTEETVVQLESEIVPLATYSGTLPNGKAGVPYVVPATDFGNTPDGDLYYYSGDLPGGIGLGNDGQGHGTLLGTPTKAGTYQFTMRQEKPLGNVIDDWTYTLTIDPRDTVVLPGGTVGTAYVASTAITVPVSGIDSVVLSGGALPNGLSLDVNITSDGTNHTISLDITGNPTVAGTYTFAVQLYEGATPMQDPYTYSITIAPAAGIGSPRNGDETPIWVFLALSVIAAAGIAFCALRLRKTYTERN